MSRPASLEVLVWLRSGACQNSMTKKSLPRVEKFHSSLLSDMALVWQCLDRLVWKFWSGLDLAPFSIPWQKNLYPMWKNFTAVYCLTWPRSGNIQTAKSGSSGLAQIWHCSAFHDKKVCIPCGKFSWQSIVWYGPGMALSRPASLEVLVWLRSGLRLSNLWIVPSQPQTRPYSQQHNWKSDSLAWRWPAP